MHTTLQERFVGAIGAALVVALLGFALVRGLFVETQHRIDQAMTLLDLRTPPPPPPPPPHDPPVHRPHPKAAKAAAPRNLKAQATPVVVPPPVLVTPLPPPPLVVAQRPGIGLAPSTGASDRPGPGTGAGGEGNGTGGDGDGGDGDDDAGPELVRGRLKFGDMPEALRQTWTGGTVSVRYDVETDGRVTHCVPTESSGSVELDRLTCQLIEQRFRYRPSRDRAGRPVRSTIVESHGWFINRSEAP